MPLSVLPAAGGITLPHSHELWGSHVTQLGQQAGVTYGGNHLRMTVDFLVFFFPL